MSVINLLMRDLSQRNGINVHTGDSLIRTLMDASEKDAESETVYEAAEFTTLAEIFGRKYDVVLGNPPYGAAVTDGQKAYFRRNYRTASGSYESFYFFLERGIELLKRGGRLGFIVPDTWLTIGSGTALRRLILETCAVEHIAALPQRVFRRANVDTVVVILRREPDAEKRRSSSVEAVVFPLRGSETDVASGRASTRLALRQGDWEDSPDHVFDIRTDQATAAILEKIERAPLRLGDLVETGQGIIPYSRREMLRRWGPEETERIIAEQRWHATERRDVTFRRLLEARDVQRYAIKWPGDQWLSYGDWLVFPRDQRLFFNEHLLVQLIRNQALQRRIVATYLPASDDPFVNSRNLANLLAKPGTSLRAVLGVLNARVVDWYYGRRFRTTYINISNLVKIPMPELEPEERTWLEARVDELLDLRKQEGIAAPAALGGIEARIAALDWEIDWFVFNAYGLSEADMKHVQADRVMDVGDQDDDGTNPPRDDAAPRAAS